MRIVVIGDLHFYRLWATPWRMLNKRVLGMANLWFSRRRKFNHALVGPMVNRILSLTPDLALFTGDLSTTALDAEFDRFAAAFKPLLHAVPCLALPGNHDRYTHASHWARVMERQLPSLVPASFPVLEPLTPAWDLLLLDAARPRRLSARGAIGSQQIEDARRLLARRLDTPRTQGLPARGLIVACHYPLLMPDGQTQHAGHRLIDAHEVRDLLASVPGPIIYLHGHVHRPWSWRPDHGPLTHLLDVNAGSPCMVDSRWPCGQGFLQLDIPDRAGEPATILRHTPSAEEPRQAADGQNWRVDPVV